MLSQAKFDAQDAAEAAREPTFYVLDGEMMAHDLGLMLRRSQPPPKLRKRNLAPNIVTVAEHWQQVVLLETEPELLVQARPSPTIPASRSVLGLALHS